MVNGESFANLTKKEDGEAAIVDRQSANVKRET
jgi:hypothetical protein